MSQTEPELKPWHCGAKNRQGKPCRARKIEGAKRCKNHGGLTPKGIDSPNFKHGRYSQNHPASIRERLAPVLSDPEFLSAADEIHMLTVRIGETIERTATGETS